MCSSGHLRLKWKKKSENYSHCSIINTHFLFLNTLVFKCVLEGGGKRRLHLLPVENRCTLLPFSGPNGEILVIAITVFYAPAPFLHVW